MMNSYLAAKKQATSKSKRMDQYSKKMSINQIANDEDSFKSEMSFSSASMESEKKQLALMKQGEVGHSLIETVKIEYFDQENESPKVKGDRRKSARFQSMEPELHQRQNHHLHVAHSRDKNPLEQPISPNQHNKRKNILVEESKSPNNRNNQHKKKDDLPVSPSKSQGQKQKKQINLFASAQDANFLQIKNLEQDYSPTTKLRRAISHEQKALPKSQNMQDTQLLPPRHNITKIQKKNTIGEKPRKGEEAFSQRSSVKAKKKKKMSPLQRSLHEIQLRESIITFKEMITKMPYSGIPVNQSHSKNVHSSKNNPPLNKQQSRALHKHKFSGAVIFDEEKDGSRDFHAEELLSDEDNYERGFNSNRGLIQKPKTSKKRIPLPDTPGSAMKLLLEEGDNGKFTHESVSRQDEQELVVKQTRGNIEVYELDFVELKPSLHLEALRKSKDSNKKIPGKIMVKRRSSQINSVVDMTSGRGLQVSQKQETPARLGSFIKNFNTNVGAIEEQETMPVQVLTVKDNLKTPREKLSKAQELMDALIIKKQKALSKKLSAVGSKDSAQLSGAPSAALPTINLSSNHTAADNEKKDLRFWDAGGIRFTMDYINHLNHVYKMMGQQTKIKRNTNVMVPEEEINIQEQENKEYTEQLDKRKRCSKLVKRVPFLWQFLKWFKNKFQPQQEEWERDFFQEADSQIFEDLEIKTPVYSSAESEQDEDLEVQYADMTKQEQYQRILELWRRTAAKAIGGGRVVKIFNELSDTIAMFGVSRRIAVVIDEDIKPLRIILQPDNKFRMAWNIVTMLLLLYTASFVPYRTSFIDVAPNGLVIWEWIVDGLFIIDIFINFVSAFENQDKNIEVRLKVIASTYIQSWFFFDLAAVFPFQLLENSDMASLIQAENAINQMDQISGSTIFDATNITLVNNGQDPFVAELYLVAKQSSRGGNQQKASQNINKLIRLARLPRLYRLMRIVRLFKIFSLLKNNASFKRLQETINLNIGVQRILVIGLVVIFMVHLMACIFYLVSKFEDEDSDNWAIFAGITDEIDSYQYLVCLYWALQTLTTVGYGDVTPRSAYEKVTGLIWMIIGVGFYSFTIGNLASIFNSIDIKAAQLQQKLAVLSEFSKRTHLPEELQNRVKRFLENNHGDHLSLSDQKQLLADVPASLRAEVVSHTHKEIIRRIKFLSDKDAPFLFTILPLLKPMKVYPKDTLYQQGDYAEEVFFIFQGRIKLYIDLNEAGDGEPMNVPFNLYVEGSYFGDSDIFPSPNYEDNEDERNQRDCTAIAEVESSLLVITRKELVEVFKRFKDIAREMKSIGFERKKHHQKAINAILDKNREKIIMQKLAKALASSRLVKKNKVPEETKNNDEKTGFFFGLKDTDSVKESVRQGQAIANQKLRMKQKLITKDPQEEILLMLQAISGGPINMDLKKKKELTSSKSPKKRNANSSTQDLFMSSMNGTDESSTVDGARGGHRQSHRDKVSSIHINQHSLNSIQEEEEELRAASSQSDEASAEENRRKKQSKPQLEHIMSTRKSSNRLPKGDEILKERRGSHLHHPKLSSKNLGNVAGSPMNGSLDFGDVSNSKMEVDEMIKDDLQWKINEEIMNGFQENMALIAGNSFEILQLYLMIQEDYSKVTEKIEQSERSIEEISKKSINLELKLTEMMSLL